MAEESVIDIIGFKGINIRESENMIQDDELVECVNFDVGRAGELIKRTGFELMHDGSDFTLAPVRLLGQFITSTYSQLLAVVGGTLYVSNDGSNWEAIEDYNVSYGTQYVDRFYMVQPDGLLIEWDGDGAELLDEDTAHATSDVGEWLAKTNATVTRDSTHVPTGGGQVNSIKVLATLASQVQAVTTENAASKFLVRPGQTLFWEADIYPETNTEICEFKVQFWDEDGLLLSALSGSTSCAADQFTNVAATGTAPANAKYCGLLFECDAPGANKAFWLANISLRNASGKEILGTPSGTFVSIYRDRMFIVNSEDTTENGNSTLYFSEINDFTESGWPSDNTILVSPGDGDFLTCTAILHDLLLIFKGNTTWGLYIQGEPVNWILRNMSPEIGCISKYTPREIEGFLYLVGTRGVYKTDGNIFEDISANILPAFENRVVNITNANIDCAVWWEDKYIVLFNPTPSTRRYFAYHIRSGGWTEYVFNTIQPSFFVEVYTTTPSRGVYCGDLNDTGKVFRFGENVMTDIGTNYDCSIQTKYFDFGMPSIMKRAKWFSPVVEGEAATDWDLLVDNSLKFTRELSTLSPRKAYKLPGAEYFRQWAIKLGFASDQAFQFYSLSLYIHSKTQVISRT